jgi:hypothetical protein
VTGERRRIVCLLLLPLLLQSPAWAVHRPSSDSAFSQFPFVLPPDYFTYFPVDAFMDQTVVHYTLTSNASVSTAFMTGAQFEDFNNSNGMVSNSITYQNGTGSTRTLRVSSGSYFVLVYAYGGTANASLDLTILPNPSASVPCRRRSLRGSHRMASRTSPGWSRPIRSHPQM